MLVSSTRASQDLPEGLTLDLIRRQARVGTLEDTLLTAYANAALELAETHTRRAFTVRNVLVEFSSFPAGGCDLVLPLGDIDAVSAVSYFDATGAAATLTPVPEILNGSRPSLRAPTAGWPVTYGGRPSYVRVSYTTKPLPLQGAVLVALLLIITHLYENRSAVSELAMSEIPLGAKALLDTVTIYSI